MKQITTIFEYWGNIADGEGVMITTDNNCKYVGLMRKGQYRTHSGSYEYIVTDYGYFTLNEIAQIIQIQTF